MSRRLSVRLLSDEDKVKQQALEQVYERQNSRLRRQKFRGHCACCNKSYHAKTSWFPIPSQQTIETVLFVSADNDRICAPCKSRLLSPKRKYELFTHYL